MQHLYFKTEASVFCLLILIFIYLFQKKCFQSRSKKNQFFYGFVFAELLFSSLADYMQNTSIQYLFFSISSICCIPVLYFGLNSLMEQFNQKQTAGKRVLASFLAIIFGGLAFYLQVCGWKTPAFLLTFAVIGLFALELYNRIRTDNLTKLYNRYGMDAELKKQLNEYRREPKDSFYIIACDLDNFKHINDTWGHPEGDRALSLVAQALQKVCRKFSSNVFRIGGDEFIIIAENFPEGIDEEITDAIKTEFDQIEFRSDFDIRISIGVALYDGVTPIDELLNNADKKLYEAKKQ